uniref:Uncharacterized protein n=1 Tax=Glossina palpalis gambiensis TaxID=67801 RepID=A0A1B0B394_9MUSC
MIVKLSTVFLSPKATKAVIYAKLILVLKQAPHVYALPCIKIEHPQQTADELLFLTKYLLRSYIKLTLTAEVKEVGGRNETTAASRQLKLKTDFDMVLKCMVKESNKKEKELFIQPVTMKLNTWCICQCVCVCVCVCVRV